MANILIVEDEPVINELIKRNLTLVGHTCYSVFDGNEAITAIKKRVRFNDFRYYDTQNRL